MKKNGFKKAELSLFCYQLSLILKSGLPIVEAMEIMETETADSAMSPVVKKISEDLQEGGGVHEAISKHPGFPAYFLGMVEIAEKTGNLQEELERLSQYYEDSEKMSQRIRSAVTYPVILLIMMTLVILFLILRVLPMFHDILRSVGGSLPESTKFILGIGVVLQKYFMIVAGAAALLVLLAVFYFRTEAGSRMWSRQKLYLPYVGGISRKMISARFSKSMSMLMKGGISFDDSMEMIISAIDNPFVREKLRVAGTRITEGEEPAAVFESLDLFPPLFLKLMKVGHRTGEMENTMEKIAGIYETEVEKSFSRITSSIEPALVIGLSVVVGLILMTVMVPLITIISNIG
ncbi:MAG: type II secretion system F family protein [Peptostreptococcaceae bacterium]|nr:type II secretion system F family protein [Peptostreptococcaceae bacterium]